ncbi:hypothetical protein PTKIN_Ptkin03bG0054900 [Pterospermum kingtungense]
MGIGVKLCFFLLFTLPLFSLARNTISLPDEDEIVLTADGRSLMASMEDYGETKANPGHDPSSKTRGSGGRRG